MGQYSTHTLIRMHLLFFIILCLLLWACPVLAAGTNLLQSVEAALDYNPELKASQEKRQAYGHSVDKARSGFFPRIAAEVGGGYSQRSDTTLRAYDDANKVRAYGDASLLLIQPIWRGGYTTADVAVRRALYDSADSQLEDSGTSLVFQAIVAHVEVLRRAELVALAKNNVKEHAEILDTVRRRTSGQIATMGELHQVEGRHARAKGTLSSYETDLDAAHAAYLNITGNVAQSLISAPAPSKAYGSLDNALQACLDGNKRIRSAVSEVEAASGEKDMARSRFYPSINLEAGPTWSDRNNKNMASSRITEVGMGLRIRWDLLSGGEDMANMAIAEARIRQAKQNLHTVMDSLSKDIEATYSHYMSSQEQTTLYEAAKGYSRLAREDYYRQFLSAQRNLLDVLDAENDYFYAAVQQVMSQGDRIIAGYRLLALSGELLTSLGLDPAILRVDTHTTTGDVENLRMVVPTSLRGNMK